MKNLIAAFLLLGGALLCHGLPTKGRPKVLLYHNSKPVVNTGGVTRSFDMEIGSTRGSLRALNDKPPGGRVVVFLDSVAAVEGKIGNWQFFTDKPCKFCLGVFNRKKTLDGRTYYVEFAGQNCFVVYENREMTTDYEIPRENRLAVNANSMVAVIYPDEKSPRCVEMESNRFPRQHASLTLGKLMVINPSDVPTSQQKHFIRPGTILEEKILTDASGRYYLGTPSFKAIIVGRTNILDIQFGPTPNSGLAMIYMNQVWGTICDRWYHINGWAKLFCDEKDFPDTDSVYYNNQPIPVNTPINLMNPHCKESENTTMFQCRSREDHPCGHDEDIYVKCKNGVELRSGAYPYEGICFVYESNYWGSVCDKNGLTITGKNHWANVCCREAGYRGARKLAWASQVIPSDTSLSISGISLHSPTCGTDAGATVNTMKGCKDGPINEHCTPDENIFVYCVP